MTKIQEKKMTASLTCVSSYEPNSIDEPAILLGGAFIVDSPEEKIAEAKKD